jgi:protoporphyrinogen oxidase
LPFFGKKEVALRIAIIGAGVMGLASALDLLEEGHQVTLFEAAPAPGGLAGSFDFGGVRCEKFYHFICGRDRVYFRWLRRLGIHHRLRWRRTRMAVHYAGRLHPFGDPLSLLRFSPLSPLSRIRYGLHVLFAKRQEDWAPLEHVTARDWLVSGSGEESYRVVWEPLLRQKFGAETDSISAAWIWSRIHRLASSRDRMFREWLGFLDGGSGVFIQALVEAVRAKGGMVNCRAPVERILMDGARVGGLAACGKEHAVEALISTVPLPLLARIGSELPPHYLSAALGLGNIGVRCLLLKLRAPFSPYFWINANDNALPLCGLVEYTNLNPADRFGGYHFVYSPLYLPSTDKEYGLSPDVVLQETLSSLVQMNPRFDPASIVDFRVFREPFAQPVCPVGFTSKLAPIRTPVANLVAADTTHLLPHDRSISDSLALAERLTGALREAVGSGLT